MDQDLTFGQWLKRRRRGLGLTQRTLGQQIGYAGETIRKIEADEARPSVQMAERLADALQISPAERPRFVRFARDEAGAEEHALSTQTAQLQTPAARRHNLPLALTTFIGRRQEQASVLSLLGSHRLVTILGPGGMGKSRLALEVAARLVETFPNGVWLTALASLTEPAHVVLAVADALGVSAAAPRRLEALKDFLRQKDLLLVLDNCEHLIGACAELAQTLLHTAPGLRLLATSREALTVAGEVVYAIPPLSLPPRQHDQVPYQLLPYEAVQLFSDRAAAALPSFSVSEANAMAVAQVCQRLEGMPLAIELAAARVKVLRVQQIVERLEDRFTLLAGGPRGGLPRHQTLRATIDWSYDLLSPEEQQVLRRAAVFAGGWTLEAAECVCAGDGVVAAGVLEALLGLARKSMVVVERAPGEEARYRLLEMIREYAGERLAAAGESAAVRERHAQFYMALAEEAEPHVHQADQARWLRRFRLELDNTRAALEWTLNDDGDRVVGIRLVTVLFRYWQLHGYLAEGTRWIERAYEVDGPPEAPRTPEAARRRGRLCSLGAYLIMSAGQAARSLALADEGLALCRAFGLPAELTHAMIQKAWSTWAMDDLEEARGLFEAALQQARTAPPRWYEAVAQFQLGGIASQLGRYDEAEAHWQDSLKICSELGEDLGVADTWGRLANLAALRGRLDEARALVRQQGAAYLALDLPVKYVEAIGVSGELALAAGDLKAAQQHLDETMRLVSEQGDQRLVGYTLYLMAEVARRDGARDRAEALVAQSLELAGGPNGSDDYQVALVRRVQAALARARGDSQTAVALSREAVRRMQPLAWAKRVLALNLNDLAFSLIANGQWAPAARLLASAEAYRAQVGNVLAPVDQADLDKALAALRERLGEAALDVAWTAGQALTLDQAVAEALDNRAS